MSQVFTKKFRRKAVELYLARDKDKAAADGLGIGRSTLRRCERKCGYELNPALIDEAEELRQPQGKTLASQKRTLCKMSGGVLRPGCALPKQ